MNHVHSNSRHINDHNHHVDNDNQNYHHNLNRTIETHLCSLELVFYKTKFSRKLSYVMPIAVEGNYFKPLSFPKYRTDLLDLVTNLLVFHNRFHWWGHKKIWYRKTRFSKLQNLPFFTYVNGS